MKPKHVVILAAVLAGLVLWLAFRTRQVDRTEPPSSTVEREVEESPPVRELFRERGPRDERPAARPIPAESEEASGSLSGRVLDRVTRAPVPGAEIVFELEGGAITELSGADGRFRLTTAEPGVYRLARLDAKGYLPYAPQWGQSPVLFSSRPGASLSGVELFLTPEELYTVRVLDETRQPVQGARVTVLPELTNATAYEERAYRTDREGVVQLAAPDWSTVRALAEDGLEGSGQVDVKAQAQRALRITVTAPEGRLGSISGSVVLPDGSPASEAAVRVLSPPSRGEVIVRCDADGAFTLRRLPPGSYDVQAQLRGYAPALESAVSPGSDVLRLELGEGLTLSGIVRTESGEEVPAFNVWLGFRRGPIAVVPARAEAFFDPEGRFAFQGLVPGAYQVVVNAFGHAPAALHNVALEERDAEVELILDEGGAIEGRIVDAESAQGIRGAEITLETSLNDGPSVAGALLETLSGADGMFRLENVNPGARGIRVRADEHHTQVRRGIMVPPGGVVPLEIELSPVAPGEEQGFEIVGIGASLGPRDDALWIAGAVPGSGAEEAGLIRGDRVLAVDGTPVVDLGFEGALQRISGPVDTEVILRVRRGDAEPFDLPVTRKKLRL